MIRPRPGWSPGPRLVLVSLVLALVTGCAVGPDYVRPTVVTPEAYKETGDWTMARPQDDWPRGAWWEIFADPDLSTLEAQVDVSNANVKVAESQFRQAWALVRQARAAYFPQVTIGFGGREPAGNGGRPSAAATPAGYQLPLDISWELDLWGRVRRTVESSQASARASAADLENARLSLQTELAQDYFQLRALDAQTRLLEATVAAYERALQLTRDRHDGGVASRVDVAQAETQLKSTQAQAIDVDVQRAQLEHAIAVLLGRPPSTFSLAPAALATQPPGIPIGVPAELLQRRPDIAGAERRMAAANAQIGVARAAYFPTVTLGGSAGFESSALSTLLAAASRFWSVGASVSQTVFDGGLRGAVSDQARAAYEGTVATYRQTVLTAFQEVEDNLAALRVLEQEARVQDEAVQAAQESLTLTLDQYRAGTASYLNVVVVQATALTNQVTAVQLQGRRMVACALLVKALGGGWRAAELPSTTAVTERKTPGPARP